MIPQLWHTKIIAMLHIEGFHATSVGGELTYGLDPLTSKIKDHAIYTPKHRLFKWFTPKSGPLKTESFPDYEAKIVINDLHTIPINVPGRVFIDVNVLKVDHLFYTGEITRHQLPFDEDELMERIWEYIIDQLKMAKPQIDKAIRETMKNLLNRF